MKDFGKIKVGAKVLDDATLDLNVFKRADSRLGDKKTIIDALGRYNLDTLVEASDFYYRNVFYQICNRFL